MIEWVSTARRVRTSANPYTFSIPAVAELLSRYVSGGKNNWGDPFAGRSRLAEFRNDMDSSMPQPSHLDAWDFVRGLPDGLAGCLIDPPYSHSAVARHYRAIARKPSALDTSNRFMTRILDVVGKKIRPGGVGISFGWTGVGFGARRGFKEVEVLVLVFSGGRYAVHVVVEQKSNHRLDEYAPPACPD